MATKIILTIDEGLTPQEEHDLRYLLSDALDDFARGVRRDARMYVATRYPTDSCTWMSDDAREKKVEEVHRRVTLATKMHDAALSQRVEHRLPHLGTPLAKLLEVCGDEYGDAFMAANQFLEGQLQRWTVENRHDALCLFGPEGQVARWDSAQAQWRWEVGA